jgi:hypothetical protein
MVSAAPLSALQRMADLLHLAPLKLSKVETGTATTVAIYHRREDNNPR